MLGFLSVQDVPYELGHGASDVEEASLSSHYYYYYYYYYYSLRPRVAHRPKTGLNQLGTLCVRDQRPAHAVNFSSRVCDIWPENRPICSQHGEPRRHNRPCTTNCTALIVLVYASRRQLWRESETLRLCKAVPYIRERLQRRRVVTARNKHEHKTSKNPARTGSLTWSCRIVSTFH